MILFFHLIAYIGLAEVVWGSILRKGAYPKEIPRSVQWIHAIVLYLIMAIATSELFILLFFIPHVGQVLSWFAYQRRPSSIRIGEIAELVASITGPALVPICFLMAKRRKGALVWYFVFWPVTFFSSMIASDIRVQGHATGQSKIIADIICAGIFLFTIAFYLSNSIKRVLFEVTPEVIGVGSKQLTTEH